MTRPTGFEPTTSGSGKTPAGTAGEPSNPVPSGVAALRLRLTKIADRPPGLFRGFWHQCPNDSGSAAVGAGCEQRWAWSWVVTPLWAGQARSRGLPREASRRRPDRLRVHRGTTSQGASTRGAVAGRTSSASTLLARSAYVVDMERLSLALVEFAADEPERALRFLGRFARRSLGVQHRRSGRGLAVSVRVPPVGLHTRGRGLGDSFLSAPVRIAASQLATRWRSAFALPPQAMAAREDLEFTYSLIDRIFRLSLGELADFSGARYDGDFSLSLEEAQRRKHSYVAVGGRAAIAPLAWRSPPPLR